MIGIGNMFSFQGKTAWLATNHKKEEIIGPILISGLELTVRKISDFDSDALGTFSGDVERPGNQLETAQLKIGLAKKKLPEEDLFISSEGAFFPNPEMPVLTRNLELILLKSISDHIEIKGTFSETGFPLWESAVSSEKDLNPYLFKRDFQNEGLILKTFSANKWVVFKDFNKSEEILAAFFEISKFKSNIILSPDLRAHRNELRRKNIGKAAENLVRNALSTCPSCGTPGFCITEIIKGLPCNWCEMPTRLPKAEVWNCQSCHYKMTTPLDNPESADPGFCDFCNP